MPDGELRFARIPDSPRRVVVDPSGVRYLNVNNDTVRRLLRVIPQAISNPLKRQLLDAYLGIEEFSVARARETLLTLLEDPNIAVLGAAETAILTSESVSRSVEALLEELANDAVTS